ncbi:hypothetical protein, partial [uncultured Shewanella sp.]|uniref:hypothetical protein n=1 Tax=uncultured Shewanella sp. TaxID=173975 RepID=UPI00262640E5
GKVLEETVEVLGEMKDALKVVRNNNPKKQLYKKDPSIPNHVADLNTRTFVTPLKEKAPAKGNNDKGNDELIKVQRHGTLKRNNEISGQSHHLNQNAAFKSVIPENDAVAVKLEGNAFRDIDTPHYNAHESLEAFWQPYRRGGALHPAVPTNKEYTKALYQSLLDSGMSESNARVATKAAMKQRVEYGLYGRDPVPRVPRRIGQKRRD